MAPLNDDPTTRVIRPAELERLSPPALQIAEAIIRISHSTWSHPWHPDAEHRVWRAVHHDGADRSALGIDFGEAAHLRALADLAGGWVAWSANPVFVERSVWVSLHRSWADRHPD